MGSDIDRIECNASASGVVVQLGIDIMPSCQLKSAAFTSGTTRGTVLSIRNAEPSSIITDPISLIRGPHSFEASDVAEQKTISEFSRDALLTSSTIMFLFLNFNVLPADLAVASSFKSPTGKFLSSATRRKTSPTAPVAPIIAIFGKVFPFYWSIRNNAYSSPNKDSRPLKNMSCFMTSRTDMITPGMKESRPVESCRKLKVCPSLPKITS